MTAMRTKLPFAAVSPMAAFLRFAIVGSDKEGDDVAFHRSRENSWTPYRIGPSP